MPVELRQYQADAIAALNLHLCTREDNPMVVTPTAGGKTLIFGTAIYQWMLDPPTPRVCILAHVKELLRQAEDKIKKVWPEAPTGIYSAGLKCREKSAPITIAGIQSIYKRAFDFDPFDVLIVDECHLIPLQGEGMYRRFIDDCRKMNPRVRVVGFTATPYRMEGGHIAGPDNILNHVCYEAQIRDLIDQGYISHLRSKATDTELKTDGVGTRNGDFIAGELERAVNTETLVGGAVAEIIAKGQGRNAWLIFASGVEHARCISEAFGRRGYDLPVVVGDTPSMKRDAIIAGFDRGEIRGVVNVSCLTTGLDVTRIDLIALLRPTKSTSLYIQMVGRGFRLHEGKSDCLVLDFAGNVRRHGPVDAVKVSAKKTDGEGEAPTKVCPQCEEIVFAGVRECENCGFMFPEPEIKHERKADEAPILTSADPWTMNVDYVEVKSHEKNGKHSLQVTYHGGLENHREWVCLEHDGFARQKAMSWWRRRFGEPVPTSVVEAMGNLFLADAILGLTESITLKQKGKYCEIVHTALKNTNTAGAIAR